MRVWLKVLKSFGYMWLSLQVFLAQYAIVIAFYKSYISGVPAPDISIGYLLLMAIYATPGVVALIVAEKLKAKGKRV